jgi:L-ribulose-5-phosphate 3-epimerase
MDMKASVLDRLAVCSWSLQPSTPGKLLKMLDETGIRRMQCALDPVRENPEIWGNLAGECASAGVEIVSGMFGCVGEDYTTIESIRNTGGIVPDHTWEQNWRNIQTTVQLCVQMNIKLVGFHAGFLPHEPADPDFDKLLQRLRKVADLFADRNIALALETGQETADTLKLFLEQLDRQNVGVNFDPANMILYDKGEPIEALRVLGPWLKQCHVKDARRTKIPGTWGEEVVVGTGEVDWKGFFQTMDDLGFQGYYAIEREAGNQRVEDIRAGRQFIEGLL